jgi:hypothetical protein
MSGSRFENFEVIEWKELAVNHLCENGVRILSSFDMTT